MKHLTVSVINNKGGVGKTTVTCNLGHALTRLKKRILIVDMDSQCNATSLLLPQNANIKYSLYELLDPDENDFPIEKCIYTTEYENLYCLPNVAETAGLEPELIRQSPTSFFRLRDKLKQYAAENYDFTLCDCPPNMGTFVIISLYASDFVIVPNEIDSAFSLEGLMKAMNLIKEIRDSGNPDLKFLRLLINKVDRRTTISKVAIQHVKKTFGKDQYFDTTIPINSDFKNAEQIRKTILRYKASAPGSRAYRKLSDEFIRIVKNMNKG